jgi:hypothetical protein
MLAVVLAATLGGCAVAAAYDAEIVSGNENEVSVKAGKNANPGPIATSHCAKFGKSAALRVVQPLPDQSVAGLAIYQFACQ